MTQYLKKYGPPGTGKTHALLEIMDRELASGVRPDRLAYLSFTVQARRVAINRALEKFPHLTHQDLPYFKTLHSICYNELGMTLGGMIKGPEDLKDLSQRLGLEFTYHTKRGEDLGLELPYGQKAGDRLLQLDHIRRHTLQSVEQAWARRFDDHLNIFHVRRFVDEYTRWKQREGLRDFTDLLEQADQPLDVDVVIVDESQDLSRLQWATLHRLSRLAERVYLAGDDDQAIFTWAGADPLAFNEQPGQVDVLGQSFRVPIAVQSVAESVIGRVKHRQPKRWAPRAATGEVRRALNVSQLRFDQEGSYRVLYRHHYQVGDLEDHVRSLGLPYTRGDRPAAGAEWGPAITGWERLRQGKALDWKQARQVLQAIGAGDGLSAAGQATFQKDTKGQFTMQHLLTLGLTAPDHPWYERLTRISPKDRQYIRLLLRHHGDEGLLGQPRVHLQTIHSAKGEEADHVILLTETSRRVRETMDNDPDSERRVFYVGVTRARETLTILGDPNPVLQ